MQGRSQQGLLVNFIKGPGQRSSFVTPDALLRFKVMPIGLSNTVATYNCMMRILSQDLKDIDSFIDNILIHSKTWADHLFSVR